MPFAVGVLNTLVWFATILSVSLVVALFHGRLIAIGINEGTDAVPKLRFDRERFRRDVLTACGPFNGRGTRRQVTMAELARQTGLPAVILSRLNTGEAYPDLAGTIALCRWMGRPVEDYATEDIPQEAA